MVSVYPTLIHATVSSMNFTRIHNAITCLYNQMILPIKPRQCQISTHRATITKAMRMRPQAEPRIAMTTPVPIRGPDLDLEAFVAAVHT